MSLNIKKFSSNPLTLEKGWLKDVENIILEKIQCEASQLTEVCKYLNDLGGKRIRPMLILACSRAFSQSPNHKPSEATFNFAAGVELIHMATLLHDDIIDQSPTRRSKSSAYFRYGITPTLLSGDFLLVKAFGICAKLDLRTIEASEVACVELTEGEMLEGVIDEKTELNLEKYIDIVRRKTASLFRLSCEIGAHLGGASYEDSKNLAQFGESAGIAFQMIDDILDITSDEKTLGKPIGTDLKQGTPSLINLLWLEEDPEKAMSFFRGKKDEGEVTKALETIKQSQVIEKAREISEEHAQKALNSLNSVSSQASHEVLSKLNSLVNHVLNRSK